MSADDKAQLAYEMTKAMQRLIDRALEPVLRDLVTLQRQNDSLRERCGTLAERQSFLELAHGQRFTGDGYEAARQRICISEERKSTLTDVISILQEMREGKRL